MKKSRKIFQNKTLRVKLEIYTISHYNALIIFYMEGIAMKWVSLMLLVMVMTTGCLINEQEPTVTEHVHNEAKEKELDIKIIPSGPTASFYEITKGVWMEPEKGFILIIEDGQADVGYPFSDYISKSTIQEKSYNNNQWEVVVDTTYFESNKEKEMEAETMVFDRKGDSLLWKWETVSYKLVRKTNSLERFNELNLKTYQKNLKSR